METLVATNLRVRPSSRVAVQGRCAARHTSGEFARFLDEALAGQRLIGTIRPECLDDLIPLNEKHLWAILREGVTHRHQVRPHSSLGPDIPNSHHDIVMKPACGHRVPRDHQVVTQPLRGGLHHKHRLEKAVA